MGVVVERKWNVAQMDRAGTRGLAEELSVPQIVAHLLLTRGIESAPDARDFMNPSVQALRDPFDLSNMEAAVQRLKHARDRDERVLVFGDYDVDGIAGAALMVQGLKRFGIADCRYGLPSRATDGYGLSEKHVNAAKEDGVDLIVTVDNGVTAVHAAERARELGIDLVVTDHHELEGPLPEVHAIINPKLDDDAPTRNICGAAVAFKVISALTGKNWDMDLAALATVADVMPLQGENRVLVSVGLRDMAERARPGLAALADIARLSLNSVRASDLAFHLAPRINAGGRVGDAITGLELLLSDEPSHAKALARTLDGHNDKRRRIESAILAEALKSIEESDELENGSVVLARKGWHTGVIGVVAARLQRRFAVPVILMGINEDGIAQGSGRSTSDFDLVAALGECRDHLIKFGGHRAAAGVTLRSDAIDSFKEAFCETTREALGDGTPVETIEIDCQVFLAELDHSLLTALGRLEPYGHGHPAPVFCTYGVEVLPQSPRELKGGHLRMAVRENAQMFTAIGFHMAKEFAPHTLPPRVDLAFTPQFNTWRGETSIQLVLKDLKPAST